MITRKEFKEFLEKELSGDFLIGEVTEVANKKLEELIAGNQVAIVMNDWKAVEEQFKDVAVAIIKFTTSHVYHFKPWYGFPSRTSGDDRITIITRDPITHEHAEAIADLYYNLGADSKELV